MERMRRSEQYFAVLEPFLGPDIKQISHQVHWKPPGAKYTSYRFHQDARFREGNIKDFGYGDLRDILAGMNTLEARLPIDKNREGLTGWSYGGFMTMFAVTQTTRFHAAVTGAGVTTLVNPFNPTRVIPNLAPFSPFGSRN